MTSFRLSIMALPLALILFGKGFAYIGIYPVYVTEAVLLALTAYALRCGQPAIQAWPRSSRLPFVALSLFLGWSFLMTVRMIPAFGLDAVRDGMLWAYAIYVPLVIIAMYNQGGNPYWQGNGAWTIQAMALALPFATLLGVVFPDWSPINPLHGRPVVAPHTSGLITMAGIISAAYILGCTGARRWWVAILVVGSMILMAPLNRGGTLAALVAIVMAMILRPKSRWIAPMLIIAALGLAALFSMDTLKMKLKTARAEHREISATQLTDNVMSVIGQGKNIDSSNTANWRKEWWRQIIKHNGENPVRAAIGIGYGPNLATMFGHENSDGTLRSPHNATINIFARSGVVGVALWIAFLMAWTIMVARNAWRSDRRNPGSGRWHWLSVCAVAALFINAQFDVFLEGPMGGIPFWAFIGLGFGLHLQARKGGQGDLGGETAMETKPDLLGMRLDATSYEDGSRQIVGWAGVQQHGYVCAGNVHMVMESYDDPKFKDTVNQARLVTPDGMPLVWCLRLLGWPEQQRVYGPTLMLHVCAAAERESMPIGLYGGSPECLDRLQQRIRQDYPRLRIDYAHAPPFRPLTCEEDAAVCTLISASGVRILFVGLGCPKQERWMAEHASRLPCVQVGVGAAFAFHAGMVGQAPPWIQRLGLEWLYRLAMEPRRLWRRYLFNNPRFVVLAGWQVLRHRLGGRP